MVRDTRAGGHLRCRPPRQASQSPRSRVNPGEGTVVAAGTPPADEQERALVDRARGRDRAAFGALYDLHVAAVYRYLYYRLGNSAECEDLTEQVFLKAWE